MQDQERFERLRRNIREVVETEAQYDVIRQRLEQIEQDSAQLLMGFVLSVYRDWQPKVGDTAIYVDASNGLYFPVVVREVRGRHLRTQATSTHHSAYYSVSLDEPAEHYERARCILPPAAFEQLRDHLPLRPAPHAQ